MEIIKDLSGDAKKALYNFYKNEIIDVDSAEVKELVETGVLTFENGAYRIVENSVYSVGVSILHDYTYLTVCSFKKLIKARKIETNMFSHGEELMQNIASAILDMVSDIKGKVVGIGVLIVGGVDEKNGISRNSYGLLNVNTDIERTLSFETGIPVTIGHNVRAVANCLIDKDHQNFVYLKHSPGIGAAVAIDGRIACGAHGFFAEIGHVALGNSDEMCRCGKIGCLETLVLDKKILEKYNTQTGAHINDPAVIYSHYTTDSNAKEVVDGVIERIVDAIDVLKMLFDPQEFMLNGGIFDASYLFDVLKNRVEERYGRGKFVLTHPDFVDDVKRLAPAVLALDNWLLQRR